MSPLSALVQPSLARPAGSGSSAAGHESKYFHKSAARIAIAQPPATAARAPPAPAPELPAPRPTRSADAVQRPADAASATPAPESESAWRMRPPGRIAAPPALPAPAKNKLPDTRR